MNLIILTDMRQKKGKCLLFTPVVLALKATLHDLVQAYEPDHTDRYVTKERHLFTLVTLTLMKKEKAEKRAERKKEKKKVTAKFHKRAKIWN